MNLQPSENFLYQEYSGALPLMKNKWFTQCRKSCLFIRTIFDFIASIVSCSILNSNFVRDNILF